MTMKTWTITDVHSDVYVEQISLAPEHVGGPARGYTVVKRRLHGGLRDGVDTIEVYNGAFRFVVVPTRGMGIWRAALGDMELGWESPVKGPVHPSFVNQAEASGLGWLDGFDELVCRCGLESNGAPEFNANGTLRYPLHGKIANMPAHKVEIGIDPEAGLIRITGVVDETRLFFNKLRLTSTITTKIGQPGLTITDVVENPSAEPCELELLYHINFGVPLLAPGAKVVLPIRRAAPRDAVAVENVGQWDTYGPETPGQAEAVFFFDLAADAAGNTQTVLQNAAGNQGVSLQFNKSELPCFTLWKNRQAAADGYVTGLEPAINFPNPRSFEKEKGRVAVLLPGARREFSVTLTAHPDVASLAAAKAAVATLQGGIVPEILKKPLPDWSRG